MSNTEFRTKEELIAELQKLIIEVNDLENMVPGDIAPDMPLFSEEGLGLDSIDAMEISTILRRRYHVTLDKETEDVDKHFATVASLAAFIQANSNN
ncbi:MAG: acyl carrier protein [Akkermansia sp.]|nr:acyl carrier protein [Akkermansia sp.]